MNRVVNFISVLVLFVAGTVMASTSIEHPAFSLNTNFLMCEGINFSGRPKPTIYIYAVDDASMTVYRLDSNKLLWSAPFPMEKTLAQIIVKQSYGAWTIDRETLHTFHQSAVSSKCEITSLDLIDRFAAEIESRAKI